MELCRMIGKPLWNFTKRKEDCQSKVVGEGVNY